MRNLKEALNKISAAGWNPVVACCLDAEPGSYCSENDSQQKKCKKMGLFQCLAAGGEPQGEGSRCGIVSTKDACCDDVVIEDVFCACCHGPKDNPRCRTFFGSSDSVSVACRNIGGTCKNSMNGNGAKCEDIECPKDGGGIDPRPGR